jgi:hypothetical protein
LSASPMHVVEEISRTRSSFVKMASQCVNNLCASNLLLVCVRVFDVTTA